MKYLAALKTLYRKLIRRVYEKEILCYRCVSAWYRGLSAEMPAPEVRTAGYRLPKWLQHEIDLELDAAVAELEAPPALTFPARLMRQLASLAA